MLSNNNLELPESDNTHALAGMPPILEDARIFFDLNVANYTHIKDYLLWKTKQELPQLQLIGDFYVNAPVEAEGWHSILYSCIDMQAQTIDSIFDETANASMVQYLQKIAANNEKFKAQIIMPCYYANDSMAFLAIEMLKIKKMPQYPMLISIHIIYETFSDANNSNNLDDSLIERISSYLKNEIFNNAEINLVENWGIPNKNLDDFNILLLKDKLIKKINPANLTKRQQEHEYYANQSLDCINELLEIYKGKNALAYSNFLATIDFNLEQGHWQGWTIFQLAIRQGRDSLIECFLAYSQSPKKAISDTAKSYSSRKLLDIILDNYPKLKKYSNNNYSILERLESKRRYLNILCKLHEHSLVDLLNDTQDWTGLGAEGDVLQYAIGSQIDQDIYNIFRNKAVVNFANSCEMANNKTSANVEYDDKSLSYLLQTSFNNELNYIFDEPSLDKLEEKFRLYSQLLAKVFADSTSKINANFILKVSENQELYWLAGRWLKDEIILLIPQGQLDELFLYLFAINAAVPDIELYLQEIAIAKPNFIGNSGVISMVWLAEIDYSSNKQSLKSAEERHVNNLVLKIFTEKVLRNKLMFNQCNPEFSAEIKKQRLKHLENLISISEQAVSLMDTPLEELFIQQLHQLEDSDTYQKLLIQLQAKVNSSRYLSDSATEFEQKFSCNVASEKISADMNNYTDLRMVNTLLRLEPGFLDKKYSCFNLENLSILHFSILRNESTAAIIITAALQEQNKLKDNLFLPNGNSIECETQINGTNILQQAIIRSSDILACYLIDNNLVGIYDLNKSYQLQYYYNWLPIHVAIYKARRSMDINYNAANNIVAKLWQAFPEALKIPFPSGYLQGYLPLQALALPAHQTPEYNQYNYWQYKEISLSVISELLTIDASSLNITNIWGDSILHVAVKIHNENLVKRLLAKGADVLQKNRGRKTARNIAESESLSGIIEAISEYEKEKREQQRQSYLANFIQKEQSIPKLELDPWNIQPNSNQELLSLTSLCYPGNVDNVKVIETLYSSNRMSESNERIPIDIVKFNVNRLLLHTIIIHLIANYQVADTKLSEKVRSISESIVQKQEIKMVELRNKLDNKEKQFWQRIQKFNSLKLYPDPKVEAAFNQANDLVLEREKLCTNGRLLEANSKAEYREKLLELIYTLAVDKLMVAYSDKQFTQQLEPLIDDYAKELGLKKLTLHDNNLRIAWVITGGPGSGKTSLLENIKQKIKQSGHINYPDLCYINPDEYKPLLTITDATEEPAFKQLGTFLHQESSLITQKIIDILEQKIKAQPNGVGPHLLLDAARTNQKRLELAAYGNAICNLIVACCPTEQAIDRLGERARQDGRIIFTKTALKTHQEYVGTLAGLLTSKHSLRTQMLWTANADESAKDTVKNNRIKILKSNNDEKETKIYSLYRFLKFIEKDKIDIEITSKNQFLQQQQTLSFSDKIKLLYRYFCQSMTLKFIDNDGKVCAYLDNEKGLIIKNWAKFLEEFLENNVQNAADFILAFSSESELGLDIIIYANHQLQKLLTAIKGKVIYASNILPRELLNKIDPTILANGSIQSSNKVSKARFFSGTDMADKDTSSKKLKTDPNQQANSSAPSIQNK